MSALRNNTKRPLGPQAGIVLATLLAAAWISPRCASAQTEPAEQKTTISGIVVNAVTRAPVARALVTTGDNRFATLADTAGHFEFDLGKQSAGSVPSGSDGLATIGLSADGPVWVSARKPGFMPNEGSGANAAPGRDVTIALTPESLIVGRVTLSTGEPPIGLSLELYFRQTVEGLPQWVPRVNAQPNSAGEFRFADLPAGSYKLLTNEMLDNDPGAARAGGPVYGFPPAYYPGALDFASAGTIELTAGQTVQADLSLTRQAYHSVKIPLNAEISPGGINVEVSLQGHKGPGYSLGYNQGQHRIEGLLPNGNYVVTAISYGEKSASGTTTLRVAGGPAEGPALALVPNGGIPLEVKEEFTGKGWNTSATWSDGRRTIPLRGPRLYLQASVVPADDFGQGVNGMFRPPQGPNDDSLILDNVPPGRYWLRLNSSRGYVAAAAMGNIDLLHQPLVVSPGSTVPIEITMRDDNATLEGTVSGISSKPPVEGFSTPQVWVYCIPLPDTPGDLQQAGIFADGQFNSSLPPGNYRVLAFLHPADNLPYRDAEAMRAYENKGQVIHLAPGQKTTVQLQAIAGQE